MHKLILPLLIVVLGSSWGTAQQTEKNQIICASDTAPYRDFDFVLGEWDFLTAKGKKIGEQIYTKRESGCMILEEWSTLSGSTGTGMSFVDPATGLWRQVWMSPMFHIDYSGKLDEKGNMVLEGTLYPNNGDNSAPVRGIWAPQPDGSIKQEFLRFNEAAETWESFFLGFAHPKAEAE